jgi:hypothetical protein
LKTDITPFASAITFLALLNLYKASKEKNDVEDHISRGEVRLLLANLFACVELSITEKPEKLCL